MINDRDPVVIAQMATRIFAACASGFDLSEEDAVNSAQEIWDRAHGVYEEDDDEEEEEEPETPKKDCDCSVCTAPPADPAEPVRKRRNYVPLAISVLIICLTAAHLIYQWTHKAGGKSLDLTCAIIHKPATGCPAGYTQEKEPRFTEADGSRQYACLDVVDDKPSCTDYLGAGEGESFHLGIGVQ